MDKINLATQREMAMIAMLKGGSSINETVDIIHSLSVFHGDERQKSDIEKDALSYWELQMERSGDGQRRNLTDEIGDFVCLQDGTFCLQDIYSRLQLSTRNEKKNTHIIIKRLCDKGILEKDGSRSGYYRPVDAKDNVIDWRSADVTPLLVRFPLGVHEFVHVHKGNVIVIAGESNAGKTAYCLNMALRNSDKFRVKYMTSEMQDGAELRIRINEFKEPESEWDKIKFVFQTDKFPDKIDPDGLNIVDYLDEGSDGEAYKMQLRIKNIADKLKTGVVVIAIQKDPNKQLGYGGAGTLNRARVYLTLQRSGILTIEKAKIWRDKNDNPNGKFIKFKLAAGCRFINEAPWQNPIK